MFFEYILFFLNLTVTFVSSFLSVLLVVVIHI